MIRRARSGRARSAGRRVWSWSAAAAFTFAMTSHADAHQSSVLDDVAPLTSSCNATLKAPRLLSAMSVVLPDAVWAGRASIHALVSFRLDRGGHPTSVIATAGGFERDAKPLFETAVVDAFKHFLFCPAGDFSTTLRWTGLVLFAPTRPSEANVPLYLQTFEPGYVGVERVGRRVGRTVVRGTYGVDGRARAVQVVESSGDDVLDRRSLDVLASARLLFRDGAAPSQPVRIERPFAYQP